MKFDRDHQSSSSRRSGPRSGSLHAYKKDLTATLEDVTYLVFDIETTGGNPERNGITEICALKVRNGQVLDKFYSLVNPQIPIPPIVRRMTGIDNKMVRNAPLIAEVMPQFVKFIGNGVLVSHNTIGDMKFLKYFSKQTLGKEIDNFFLCTHLLVERLVKEAPNKSLKGLAQYFKFVPKGEVHRADADAYLTLDLFLELRRRIDKQNIKTLADAVRFQGDYESGMRLGWAVPPEKLNNLPDDPGVFQLFDRNGHVHFVSSATSLRRDIRRLLKYQQLPKQMLRLVLNSYDLKFTTNHSIFDAVYDESRYLGTHKKLFRPWSWHQRIVPAVCLSVNGDGQLDITMGEHEDGVFAAYGSINDRKEMGKVLSEVTKACSGEPGKRMICHPRWKMVLSEYLAGRRDIYEERLRKRFNSSLMRLMWVSRRRIGEQLTVLEKLKHVKLPTGLVAINELKGVLLVKTNEPGNYRMYRLKYGHLTPAGHFHGELDEFSQASSLIRRQLKYLVSRKGYHHPLSHKEAMHANAAYWWIFYCSEGSDGRFFTDSELAGLLNS